MSFRFGIASEINIEKSTVAFCGTILFLVTFETITHKLEDFIGNSPTYNKMLQRIYKELMINGFVSFALSMYMAFYPHQAESEWIHVMEFCGYVLFFVAIFFVAHGLYIIGLSLFSAKQYDMYHSMPISDILQNITKIHSTWRQYLFDMRYLPFSSVRSVAEFKIIYALFRDTYWLPSNFDYGAYLAGCFERYSLRIVKIGKISWALMFLLGIFNYIRVKYMGPYIFNCKGFKTASDASSGEHGGGHGGGHGSTHSFDYNYLSENEDSTGDHNSGNSTHLNLGGRYGLTHKCSQIHLELFFYCSCVMALYVIAVYLIGRIYVVRLIAHSGVTEIADYGEFLALEESASLKSEDVRTFEINVEEGKHDTNRMRASSSRRMSINTLRTNIDRAVSKSESDKVHKSNSIESAEFGWTLFQLHYLTPIWEFFLSCFGIVRVRPTPTVSIHLSPRHSIQGIDPLPTRKNSRRSSLFVTLDRSGARPGTMVGAGVEGLTAIEQFKLTKKSRSTQRNSGSGSNLVSNAFRRVTSLVDKSKKEIRPNSAPVEMKLSEDFSHIYIFKSPQIYYWAVECCIVLNSLYLSMWVTNYITVVRYETSHQYIWQIIMMSPLFIVMPLIGEIVKTASMLSAIAELEIDIMGSVLEEMEDQKLLLEQLRTSAANRIGVTGDALKEFLETLFNSIDYTHKGYLNKSDIREFFRALHLHYSNDKFNRLFFVIDHNKDGEISFNELYRLLCPSEVEEEERKTRAEAISRMKEVVRTKPKGSFARLKSLILPERSNSITPIDETDEKTAAAGTTDGKQNSNNENRKNSSWKWFSSGDVESNKNSSKQLSMQTQPPSHSGKNLSGFGISSLGRSSSDLKIMSLTSSESVNEKSPIAPVVEEKGAKEEEEEEGGSEIQHYQNSQEEILIPTEELRNRTETTKTNYHQPILTIDTTTPSYLSQEKENRLADCEIRDLDDLV